MKRRLRKFVGSIVLGAVFYMAPPLAYAQFNSAVSNASLNAVMPQSLTVSLDVATVNFTLANGASANPGDSTITVTMDWVLNPSIGTVDVYAYFDDSSVALTNGIDDIPAANVEGSVDTGPLTAFTGSSPFGGVALMLDSITILGSNKNSSQNSTLDLNINLFSLPGISAGTYSGTMHIQAQAL